MAAAAGVHACRFRRLRAGVVPPPPATPAAGRVLGHRHSPGLEGAAGSGIPAAVSTQTADAPRPDRPSSSAAPPRRPGRFRRFVRWTLRAALVVALLAILAVLLWLRGALYHRFVAFPREAAAWTAIRADRQEVPLRTAWTEYRGILHSHSELSHDCEVPFPEILRVLQDTGTDFIALSDHCDEGRADFSAQWRGLREGKLFIPGFEMRDGFMPFGVASGIVLSNRSDTAELARQVIDGGGVIFFAHPEEPREWDLPALTGMEIYNIHADLKDEAGGLAGLLPDLLVNLRRHPDHVFRRFFDRPEQNLRRWDELNRTRPITGIAGNDCHQNTGFRGIVTTNGTLRIEDTSPETLAEWRLRWFLRPFLRAAFGPLEPGRTLFHVQLDPYERMTRFVGTHVLARELSEPAILDALRAGRAFVGFDGLADSRGFLFLAERGERRVVMGESMPWTPETRLRALAPHSARFTVLRDGTVLERHQGREMTCAPPGPGVYRVEAELEINGGWVPWIYANPIRLE